MIQRAGRIDRLFSPHDTVYIYNVMPEQGLEDLLQLVGSLTRKLETIEDAVALDASVLGEQIEARELDAVMKIRAGGAAADAVYLEGERTQGLDAGLDVLNQYLDLMRSIATQDLEDIPDGVYSVVEGPRSGVFVMLRMPEELTGEVFWRFYPLDDIARPDTSPPSVLETIQADPETPRYALPASVNPFGFPEWASASGGGPDRRGIRGGGRGAGAQPIHREVEVNPAAGRPAAGGHGLVGTAAPVGQPAAPLRRAAAPTDA